MDLHIETRFGILVVDDDPCARRGMIRTLRCSATEAKGTADAIAAVERTTFDAVVTDVCLNEPHDPRSGLLLVAEIRRMRPSVGIVVTSGLITHGHGLEELALRAGANAYIDKIDFHGPFARRLLRQVVGTDALRRGPVSVPEDIAPIVQAVIDCDAESATIELQRQQLLGQIAHAASAQRGVMKACATAIGRSRSLLSGYVSRDIQWRRNEQENLLALRTIAGRPVTRSHIDALARLRSKETAQRLLERIVAENWSVPRTRAEVEAEVAAIRGRTRHRSSEATPRHHQPTKNRGTT
jgi:CheY-like chemotaxis protein